jgi:hypothetical protein
MNNLPTWNELFRELFGPSSDIDRYHVLMCAFDLGGIGCEHRTIGRYASEERAIKAGYRKLPKDRPMVNTLGVPTSDSCDYFWVVDTHTGETVFSQVRIIKLT